jgi:CRISPR-associated protein Csb2
MFALVFRFPAGRYHATPWGRNVNEADVAWPPEPWRILRALIATYWRKGNRERWSEDDLAALIEALAERPPVYRLPEFAVHAHTRHYMPIGEIKKGRENTTLVFDAFARLPADAEIVAAWPELTLPAPLFELADDLARGLGYLGRAESWADCEARAEWDGAPNCLPEGMDGADTDDRQPVRLIAPYAAADYAAQRGRLHTEFDERERQNAITKGKKPPTSKALATACNKAFGATLPARLVDALALDTSDYQRFGWSRPPASREVIYFRRPLGPALRSFRRNSVTDDPARFTVARFVLAGRPRPRIEDAVKIGELMRLAALAQFGWAKDEASGRWRPKAPPLISGRDAQNRPLKDAEHRHAFWLPEDADGDGEIDHVVVYARGGFDQEVRSKLDRLTRLWIEQPGRVDEGDDTDLTEARKEWRLALEGFGIPEDFRDASRLLGRSQTWESVTPFLAAGHLKAGGYPAEVRRLLARRGLREPTEIALLRPQSPGVADAEGDPHDKDIGVMVRGRLRRAIHFHRFRSRGGERQPDTIGTFLRLSFDEPIEGPLALGYACHFGLGLFAAREDGG